MDTEASPFESSEMLATFLTSTPLLSMSWSLCDRANTMPSQGFVAEQMGSVGHLAFSGVQLGSGPDPTSGRNLEPLVTATNGLFFPLEHQFDGEEGGGEEEGKEPVLVHAGFLRIFLSVKSNPNFQNRMLNMIQNSKSIVIAGHGIGGTVAGLCALWLLSYLQSISSNISVLCITFGSPLLGNESLSRAILREGWSGNFCHVVSKHDVFPRLFFAPLAPLNPQLHSLLQFWQLSMTSPPLALLAEKLLDEGKSQIFRTVLASLEGLAKAEQGKNVTCGFWPFGNYFFCSEDGAICNDNATFIVKMMHSLLLNSSPSCSIEDHLKYGYYVEKASLQVLTKTSFPPAELPESSYEAGVALALQSSGIACQDESVARPAKNCLKLARRMGRTPNLNCANLAIKLSKITPYRAEIEWYKATCDQSDAQMGYYDSFKQRGASKRDFKVNMNRRAKWVNGSQFYMLLVEPLDIAEYYRTGMHRKKGHYISNGRERRYKIFERWWKERPIKEEEKKTRSTFASSTQDTCFWARVEEARERLDNVRNETDPRNQALLLSSLDDFSKYASGLVERKEVSKDVVARNSSYCMWVRDYEELKSQYVQLHP
ncbi:hypothetical protein P3X46_013025 [Hevea brasiliensis]|uniref:Lipase-like PAD4 n=1 Tax=Hevea brasiliensis TaxID=3981 RepID=A0ABQ9MG69_HEVBR|nr:lipase-like PAD4 isoform X2 [Hevea brasiliensis]KAJ9177863.1 hypothetical protein P3X46_013025 [Hevea brasiliensis]